MTRHARRSLTGEQHKKALRVSAAKLKKAGIPPEDHDRLAVAANSLPNIQLLDGPANIEKRATLPHQWVGTFFQHPDERSRYIERHLLGGMPEGLEGAEEFWNERRNSLQQHIEQRLGVSPAISVEACMS